MTGFLRRSLGRPAAQAAPAAPPGVHCMLRRTALARRWRPGRLLTGAVPLGWAPSFGRGSLQTLPADLRRTGVRGPTVREGMSVNPGSRIVECGSAEGPVLIAVMPGDLAAVLAAVPEAAPAADG
ncbi:hypothetical protein LG634_04970 [Streptomyces bambusae]|uniref:hypothetical protein n=1 Tax=Streptomyces bambusae TaxID=1550616 RepID=UPI001CFCF7DA|nr:hypothetical protein [Streptomyces bambusae]MCB5164188.1 hypothetical protein [Streptomyces bambusae]